MHFACTLFKQRKSDNSLEQTFICRLDSYARFHQCRLTIILSPLFLIPVLFLELEKNE